MIKMNWPKAVPETIRSSTGPSFVCVLRWREGLEAAVPINLEKKPLAGRELVGNGSIGVLVAEDDEESDTREVIDGLCPILFGRDGDDGTFLFGEEGINKSLWSSVWGRPSGKTVLYNLEIEFFK